MYLPYSMYCVLLVKNSENLKKKNYLMNNKHNHKDEIKYTVSGYKRYNNLFLKPE